MSLISSIGIAQSGLSASQAAITVVSNNIANVDTAGYSKLKVNLASVINFTPSAGNTTAEANSLGGVQISDVERYSNSYLQNYYWRESSSYSYLSEYSSIASNIEDLVNELNDTGLAKAFSDFYNAADALNDNPSDITARENYVNQAKNVCSVFNTMASNLNNVKKELVGNPSLPGSIENSKISSNIDEVNGLLDQLAEVNNDIIKTNSGTTSSTSLLDQRDALITKLTKLIPVKVSEKSNSTVDISLGEYDLVNGIKVSGYLRVNSGTASEPAIVSIVNPGNIEVAKNINNSITSGTIGAILDVCGSAASSNFTVDSVMKQLDTLASNFAGILNNIQTNAPGDTDNDGTTPLGIDKETRKLIDVSGYTMFMSNDTTNPVIKASNISINNDIIEDPYLVAAARLNTTPTPPDTYSADAIGNAKNSEAILKTRTSAYGGLGHQSFEDYLTNIVTNVGNETKSLNTSYKNESLVLSQVETSLQNATGVNLDEELVDLIKFQRAYQASARVFNTCSELLEELINLGR